MVSENFPSKFHEYLCLFPSGNKVTCSSTHAQAYNATVDAQRVTSNSATMHATVIAMNVIAAPENGMGILFVDL